MTGCEARGRHRRAVGLGPSRKPLNTDSVPDFVCVCQNLEADSSVLDSSL